ncbi:DUF411 domain-containing protein [Halopseudomonas xiamenensis]|uniref:DUF411 domain-containing protein n=1 Tax=Halopseudomonas xiamenensis TaxID=157792 RepID=UPI001628705B|nr:DUF411 domain-containing protein [Halopseudomonas xiamenensis]
MHSRLRFVALTAMLLGGLAQAADNLTIDVHRDANCGCCKDWIKHMETNGFTVNDHVEPNMATVKQELGVPPRLGSCHTAVLNGQFIEGHVPAEQVLALQTRPDLLGIAVPGMPMGSPGMEYGDRQDPYQVVGLTKDGQLEVVAEYPDN